MVDSFSVVIPTHERPVMLRAALASVLAQTRPAGEIVVVDDAGDAATRRVVDSFAAAAAGGPTSVRYVHNDGATGAPASRNLGAAYTTGEVIALLDDDDTWAPTYLQAVADRFDESGADVVLTWRADVRGRFTLPYPSPREGLTAADVVAVNPGAGGSNFCVRRDAFVRVGGFDEALPMSDDKDLFLRLLQAGARYAVVEQRLVLIGHPPGRRVTHIDQRHVAALRAYYAKHFRSCRPRDHRELRRKIRRAEWRLRRDHQVRGWRRHLYTLGLLALARPRAIPTPQRVRALLLAPRPDAGGRP